MRFVTNTILAILFLQFFNNLEHLGQYTTVFSYFVLIMAIFGFLILVNTIYDTISHFDTTKDNS